MDPIPSLTNTDTLGPRPADAAIVLFLIRVGVENPARALAVDRLLALVQASGVADAPAMHQLQDERSALGVTASTTFFQPATCLAVAMPGWLR